MTQPWGKVHPRKAPKEIRRLREIEAAARRVYDGLNDRLDAAREANEPMPVFDGIAELHDALNRQA